MGVSGREGTALEEKRRVIPFVRRELELPAPTP